MPFKKSKSGMRKKSSKPYMHGGGLNPDAPQAIINKRALEGLGMTGLGKGYKKDPHDQIMLEKEQKKRHGLTKPVATSGSYKVKESKERHKK